MNRIGTVATPASVRRWPLIIIASPAAVAIWSGWVALGAMCGFGPVNLLPGIGSGFTINTAITLPVGVEAYGAYALGIWIRPGSIPERARGFAKRSAIGSLLLGMVSQPAYHVLAAGDAARAPLPVIVLVSVMPVVMLGFGAGLTHLLRSETAAAVPDQPPVAPAAPILQPLPEPETAAAVPAPLQAVPDVPDHLPEPEPPPEAAPGRPSADAEFDRLLEWLTSGGDDVPDAPELHQEAEAMFAADLVAGRLPGIRAIREGLHVGQDRATQVQAYLRPLTGAR